MVKASTRQVREDFDRIALLTEQHGGAGDAYHSYLISQLPPRFERALEIGCGAGAFTRLLAERAQSVNGIDLSPQMIRLAREQSTDYQNIEYTLADVMSYPLAAESYDCVVSLATLHHLSLEQLLPKMKDALKPDGLLIIHDLVADDGMIERAGSALAYPFSVARRLWKTGRLRAPRAVRDAWNEHGRTDVYLTLNEVGEMCGRHLKGARIQRHLLWRYTVVWRKPLP
ncbi:MAG: hypothetical protein QOF02_632 [Blastocatellia bacterium]|nr:hypothetical protein [Blastocatellia bacterium]